MPDTVATIRERLDRTDGLGARTTDIPILLAEIDRLSQQTTTPDAADRAVRVLVVVNHRRGGRVHGVTCDQTQAIEWVQELHAKYHGDNMAVTTTVGLVYPGRRTAREEVQRG